MREWGDGLLDFANYSIMSTKPDKRVIQIRRLAENNLTYCEALDARTIRQRRNGTLVKQIQLITLNRKDPYPPARASTGPFFDKTHFTVPSPGSD